MQLKSDNKIFNGQQQQFSHHASTTNCEMTFSIFLPPQAQTKAVPVLYWLSGLTCNDQNFVTKAGAQKYAAKHGIAIVCPDTSPRGEGVADDPQGSWDFGLGAGFYVNATRVPFEAHYQMYDYVSQELPALINDNFPVDPQRQSIFGHSMGGHGAITIALNHPDKFRSVSAFSPISSPLNCPWGEKALSGYLGEDRNHWQRHDSCELVSKVVQKVPMLVDQGSADDFLEEQLKTPLLINAAKQANYPAQIRYQEGYDHSYYFIASFIGEHIAFHSKHLNA